MGSRRFRFLARSRKAVQANRLLQIAVVFGFWILGEGVTRALGLPVPGGIVGMLIVLGLLLSGQLGAATMRRGADWFLAEMLLFFVPAVLAVLNHPEFLGLLGIKLMAVILAGTLTVMGVTALTVDLCYRWMERHAAA